MTKKLVILLLAVALVTAMAVPALAAGFTPSVEGKPAPEVVTQTGADGKEYAAFIYDLDGNEVAGVPTGDLLVTPLSASEASSAEIQKKLEDAYEQLKSVNSLTELSDQLEPVIKDLSPDITVEDLVVRDLFDVTVTGTYAEYLLKEGSWISVRFALSADAELLAAVLHNVEEKTWETVSNDRISRNKDYTVDVVFHSLSPVAFLFDAGQLNVDPNAPSSPQTGEADFNGIGWLVVGGAVVLTSAVYVARKKRSSQKA